MKSLFVLLAGIVAVATVSAQSTTSATYSGSATATVADAPSGTLTLTEAIDRALQRNLSLRVERLNLDIAETRIDEAEGVFSTTLSASVSSGQETQARAGSTLDGLGDAPLDGEEGEEGNEGDEEPETPTAAPFSDSRAINISARRSFSTGTQLSVGSSLRRSDSNSGFSLISPDYRSSIDLEVTQPLLRGFGRVINTANIARAEDGRTDAELALRSRMYDLLETTELAYWDIGFAEARLALEVLSVQVAEQLVDETTQLREAGLATDIEVLQARSSLASRQEQILLAEQSVADARDNLFSLFGRLNGISPEASDVAVLPLPADHASPPAFDAVWSQAWDTDITLARQQLFIDTLERDLLVARNDRLPQVDLTLSTGFLGREDRGIDAFESSATRDGDYWSADVRVTVPWGFRQEEAREARIDIQIVQAENQLDDLRLSLLQAIRSQYRDLVTSHDRLAAAQASVELAEATYEQEEARYEAGLINFRDLLDAQRERDTARLSLLEAHRSILRAQVRLARLDGSLPTRYGLVGELVESNP